jgi:hypothetical protein
MLMSSSPSMSAGAEFSDSCWQSSCFCSMIHFHYTRLYQQLTLSSTVVTICTTCFIVKSSAILPTQCIHVFCIVAYLLKARELRIQQRQPLLSKGFANKHISMATVRYNNTGKQRSLHGPCRGVISRTSLETVGW